MRFVLLVSVLSLGASLSGPAVAISPPAAPSPTEWKAWGGGWVRLEADGNLSCLSFDAANCAWENSVQDPKNVDPSYIQPLVCGVKHRAVWNGVNGYNDYDSQSHYKGTQHWCRSAYASLFVKQWDDYSMLGAKHWLAETPAGDAMCHSTDGRACTPVIPGESAPPPGDVHPLVCGAHHRRMMGYDGYDEADHWCATPKIDEDFGQQLATDGDWTQVKAKGWIHGIEPAMLVRVKVPDRRALTLRAQALLTDSLTPDKQELPKEFFGLEFGNQLRFHLGGESKAPPPSWKPMAASNDEVIVGMTVTPRGNACFFGANGGAGREGRFFAKNNFLGDTRGILDNANRPILFKSSSVDWRTASSLVDWRADAGPEIAIQKVLMLYARFVPVEGDDTGEKRRPIYYAADCDQQ